MSTPTRHQPPSGRGGSGPSQELLYDPSIPSLSHAERARTLCALARSATLCTLNDTGHPYGSLVLFALCPRGRPALLISELAEHTKHLKRDARCSLLVAEDGTGNPLARGRVTIVGSAEREDGGVATDGRDSFLKKNPAAIRYADFADFAVWRIEVEAVRYIGGFGRMSFVDVEGWEVARPDALAVDGSMPELVERLNGEGRVHRLARVAQRFSRAESVAAISISAVDQYGIDMDAETEVGPRPIRVAFEHPAGGVAEADELVARLEQIAVP